LYELNTSTSSIRATGNHLFPVWRDGLQWVRTDDLRPGDCVATPRIVPTTREFARFESLLPEAETWVHLRDGRRAPLAQARAELHASHQDVEAYSTSLTGFGASWLRRFPVEITEDLAYVCGLIASDGTFGPRGHRQIQF